MEQVVLFYNGGFQHDSNNCDDTGDPRIMLILYTSRRPTESKSFFDDDIKDLFNGFTKTSIKGIEYTIAWKDNMSHIKGTKSYNNDDFDY